MAGADGSRRQRLFLRKGLQIDHGNGTRDTGFKLPIDLASSLISSVDGDVARSVLTHKSFVVAALLAAAAALVAAFVIIGATPGRADPAIDSEEAQFLVLINNYRAQNGVGPLVLQPELDASADWLSTDMAAKDYFSHTDSLGRSPSQRAAAFGYPSSVGENAACGFTTAQDVFAAWKNSSGHNANMLYASYKVIGIGRAFAASTTCGGLPGSFPAWFWTTDFGLVVQGSTSTPGPTPAPSPTLIGTPAATATPTPTASTTSPTPAPTATSTAAPTGTPTATPAPRPRADVDCDGTVTPADARQLLRYWAGLEVSQPPGCPQIGGGQPAAARAQSQSVFGDVDCSGGVDALDALDALRYVAHLPLTLPEGCPGMGT